MHRSLRTLVVLTAIAVSAGTAMARVFVLPHVLEKSGRITNTNFTFDTQIEMAYGRGLTDGKPGKGAQVDLYLYDASGTALTGAGGQDVCNPCGFPIGTTGAAKKLSISIDDLIVAKGGFASSTDLVTGFAVIVVSGDDKNVAMQGFVVNSHTGPFDLSFNPMEIRLSK